MINVGDWVAYQRDNGIVIGEVRYVQQRKYGMGTDIITSTGTVNKEHVLEVRKKETINENK